MERFHDPLCWRSKGCGGFTLFLMNNTKGPSNGWIQAFPFWIVEHAPHTIPEANHRVFTVTLRIPVNWIFADLVLLHPRHYTKRAVPIFGTNFLQFSIYLDGVGSWRILNKQILAAFWTKSSISYSAPALNTTFSAALIQPIGLQCLPNIY